jgi:hypothetical protein
MPSLETHGHFFLKSLLVFLAICNCSYFSVSAQEEDISPSLLESRKVFKVDPTEGTQQLADHPLQAALKIAHQTAERIDREVNDYTCDLVMRERIRGRLSNIYLAQIKLRFQERDGSTAAKPFSVYLHFAAPSKVKGREVLYVHNQNDGKLLARNGGESHLKDITISMVPNSKRAMRGRHYPVTEIGIENIIERLIEEAQRTMQIDRERRECQVRIIENARIEGRLCRCVQVGFPEKRENLKFHLVRVFLDNETGLPIRYAAYSWPREAGAAPRLIEEYTFLNLKVNVGLSDTDFDRENPTYNFYSGKEASAEAAHPQSNQDN